MFDVGFWEIIIIVLVALLVVGPERLPGLAREIGRWVGKTRRFVHSVRSDFEQELQTDELRNMLKSQDREIRQLKSMMDETETSLREDIEDTERHLREDIEGKASGPRKGLSEREQDALSGTGGSGKPPVRDKPSMHDPEPAGDAPGNDADAPEVRRVPTSGDLDGNLMTDDPALAAEREARAADAGPSGSPSKPRPPADARSGAAKAGGDSGDHSGEPSGSEPTHDDQTPDQRS